MARRESTRKAKPQPGASGRKLTRALGSIRGDLPVVLIPGYVGDELAMQAGQSGNVAVFQKGAAADELADLLCKLPEKPSTTV